jgi:hypothetical protein
MPQELHDALAAVRGSGKYYGGTPVVPGPSMRIPMEIEPPALGWNSAEPFMTAPRVPAGNENVAGPRFSALFGADDRSAVLNKLMANRDFRPVLGNYGESVGRGRLWWRSLSPEENEVMQRIGWARAPNVTRADEISEDPLTSLRAWERNIRHWHELASPPKE